MNDDHFPWSPISAYDLHTTYTNSNKHSSSSSGSSNNKRIIQYSYKKNFYEQRNILESLPLSLPLSPSPPVTTPDLTTPTPTLPLSLPLFSSLFPDPVDLQVWRIHPTWNIDTCLTYTTYTTTTSNNSIRYNLTWSTCIDHRRERGSVLLYDASQLFSLYIQPHNTYEFNIQTNKYTQTTLITTNNNIKNITRIMIYNYLNNNGILCLTVLPKADKVLVYIYTVIYL